MNLGTLVPTCLIPTQCSVNFFKPTVTQNHLINDNVPLKVNGQKLRGFQKNISILSKTATAVRDSTLFLAILTYLCSLHRFK